MPKLKNMSTLTLCKSKKRSRELEWLENDQVDHLVQTYRKCLSSHSIWKCTNPFTVHSAYPGCLCEIVLYGNCYLWNKTIFNMAIDKISEGMWKRYAHSQAACFILALLREKTTPDAIIRFPLKIYREFRDKRFLSPVVSKVNRVPDAQWRVYLYLSRTPIPQDLHTMIVKFVI